MKANYRAAASAGLLLSACAGVAQGVTTVQTTIGPHAAGSNFDLIFSTSISSATQLVSIDDGSVFTGEGAAFSISAVLTNDQVVEVFAAAPGAPFQTVSLSTFTGNAFTSFAIPQDVKALRFTSTGGNVAGTFTFATVAVVTLATVPEPAAAIMMLLGVIFLAVRRRRMAA